MIKNYKKLNYKMSAYYPPYKNSSNIKVELDLTNYATKDDVKNITHVDVSGFASKTNLATLRTEVDKIDVDKLKTTPTDLAKLSNVVKNDFVKKTDYSTKVTSIEAQIAGLTKNTGDNLADITKLGAIDTNSFVTRTKFSADANSLDDKIDGVETKQPDISGLATKASLNSYLQTSTFNSKVTEIESKIKDADIIAKSANTKANGIRSNLTSYAKKADVAMDITTIKNDYVTNASLSSQLKDLKRGLSFNRGFFFYLQQNHLVYKCKIGSFIFNKSISNWESTGIFNSSDYYSMNGIENTKKEMPTLKNDERFMFIYKVIIFNKIMY